MIQSNQFVAGRVYSVIYLSDVPMVGKREFGNGKELNPLADELVTVRRVSTIQAAGEKTWTNFLAKRGESPAGAPTWWAQSNYNSCVVVGKSANTIGKEYIRGLPRGVTKEEYFIAGRPATAAEASTIRLFKKSQGEQEFILLSLAKLENVDSGAGEAE